MKSAYLLIFGLLLVSVFAGFASADPATTVTGFIKSVSDVTSAIITGVQPIARLIIGTPTATQEIDASTLTTVGILLLLIVFSLVYSIIDSIDFFSSHTWVQVIVSIAVSILSVRFLSGDMISAILVPYKALGIALTASLPFVIYFVFVEIKLKTYNSFLKKVLWIFFGVIYVFIYFLRQANQTSPYVWIYFVTALLAFFVALIEGTIQSWVARGQIESAHADSKKRLVREYKRQIVQLDEDLSKKIIDPNDWERETKKLKAEIANLLK
jgi:hypothetical protein